MAPGPDELEWKPLKDFSSGLWERDDDRECPENGLLFLEDAYPLQAGGLRAAQRFTAVGQTGLTTGRELLGPQWIQNPEGLYCLSVDTVTGGVSLHKTATTSPPFTTTSWSTLHSWSLVDRIDGGWQLSSFRTDAVGYRGYFNLSVNQTTPGSSVATAGIWRTDGSTATFTYLAARPLGCWPFQARLFTIVDDQGFNDKIVYTEPASHAAPSTANILRPGGERYGGLKWMATIQPSDLMTLKYGYGLFLVQGDVTGPLTRELTFAQNVSQQFPAVTDQGLAFVVPEDSVYMWTGSETVDVSPSLSGTPMQPSVELGASNGRTNKGHMAHAGHFLYAGKDYVMDLRTRAWFRLSSLRQNGEAHTFTVAYATGSTNGPWIIAGTENLTNGQITAGTSPMYEAAANEGEMTRASSYSFTVPLLYLPFFSTTLRAIEYHIESFTPEAQVIVELTLPELEAGHQSPTKTLEVQTKTVKGARPHKVRFNVGKVNTEWVKIKTTIKTTDSGEAPMLEQVVIGLQPGTRNRVG
jgi:hypothetical protein